MNKLLRHTILLLLCAVSLLIAGIFFLSADTKVSGQQTSKGWRIWVKTSPCAGSRADWLTVAQNNPSGGGNFYASIDLIDSSAVCKRAAPNGCTFEQANAEKENFKNSDRFPDYCCQDYSIWKNTRTGELSVVQGKFATAGSGWEFEDGPMCCEEAEELSGKTGLCGGIKAGGGRGGKGGSKIEYIGCFKDTSAFDLDGFLERSRNNTPQACLATCRAKGFKYAGVQYGESCLCGNSYGKYGAADNCNMKCTGDASQNCGGYSANSIYETGASIDVEPTEIDLSGTWYNTVNINGKWDHTLPLKRVSAGKWAGTMMVWYDGKRTTAFDTELTIESLGGGKISVFYFKQNLEQSGTYTKDKIVIEGVNGPLIFTKR